MKLQTLVSILLVVMASVFFIIGLTLDSWSREYLDPCCTEICGRTTSAFGECLPVYIAGLFFGFGIILILLGVLNLIKLDKK